MKPVYRVENRKGHGPYFQTIIPPHVDPNWNDGNTPLHPTPSQDGMTYPGPLHHRWFFGFASLRAYRRWFSAADRPFIQSLGFCLVKYLVPVSGLIRGKRQVAFRKDVARRVDSREPTAV